VYLAIGAAKYPLLRFELINGRWACGSALLVGSVTGSASQRRLATKVRWIEVAVAIALAAVLVLPVFLSEACAQAPPGASA